MAAFRFRDFAPVYNSSLRAILFNTYSVLHKNRLFWSLNWASMPLVVIGTNFDHPQLGWLSPYGHLPVQKTWLRTFRRAAWRVGYIFFLPYSCLLKLLCGLSLHNFVVMIGIADFLHIKPLVGCSGLYGTDSASQLLF